MHSRIFTSAIRPAFARASTFSLTGPAARMGSVVRQQSSTRPPVEYSSRKNFKQTWLMDGATYPIIVIITFAVTMCSGFTAYKFLHSPDNRVNPRKRTSLMRDWK
ncbi:hypothetical protein NSK_003287 [Nannochloropsis salina CCMP1776]|uniref:Uncharacterized protein n=1 Tax=Nannochloropsis salina CCMP1776 TaxID=1027361 RepID=A0A4D9D6Y8_9STRA|nr:hypothetical protein NSK_003287 [Nannochloropsis salina CCMP1776]|eukprot:TFJ85783.1 hypothetical protein NSK_003287 [Nannochloropsis salina CCMP1776]